ncbi:MAG TPA: aminotransferase class I/II-fold pyridoxal phosphate-dependent enzyme [Candidatus Thermoplasmatota archaeon]|nr:aminotransferase class I/II-fold pyridoxal phosphate-dependent enzyme [Candidatus Thermoplasmatota archaeon]
MAVFRAAKRTSVMDAPIRDVLGPARALERAGHAILKLNIGDPCKYDFRPPAELVEALQAEAGLGDYGDSEGDLLIREAIARWEREGRGIAVAPDDIIFTGGVSEALQMLFGAMLEPGDEILVPGPTYPQYLGVARYFGATPVEYPSTAENGWIPDLEAVRRLVTPRTKALCVISPNNPTGAVYPKRVVEGLAKIAHEKGLVLVSDDIYNELVFEGERAPSAASVPGPVVILNGFSKNWLVPGWRAGYVAFRHAGELAEIREAVLKQARSRLSAPLPAQRALAKVLRPNAPHLADLRRRLGERAELVAKRVAESPDLALVKPAGAFYSLIGIKDNPFPTDKEWVLGLLHEEKVLAVHGSGFGEAARNHFRIVNLPDPATLDEAMTRVVRYAAKARRR